MINADSAEATVPIVTPAWQGSRRFSVETAVGLKRTQMARSDEQQLSHKTMTFFAM
ncbi:hypothetical protein [Geomesophilobacter sediminis]|uniref:Uncharacterized protein n=1 Tax=Geomesophilobacter sediminis TaxID=2798584 RepID=A0A8J7IM09_9BACT|nr:hypothetical protein [Geomesophilobacter sediminis]MBJ6723603.1 hypothetical protein [Geomesophilobacter sediminis]